MPLIFDGSAQTITNLSLASLSGNVTSTGSITANIFVANNTIISANTITANTFVANTSITAGTINTNSITANTFVANTSITAGTINTNSITTPYSYGQNRKEFCFGFQNTQVWFYIGYLPASSAGTGDCMAVEITGNTGSVNGKGRIKLAFGQRNGFWYSKSQEGPNPQIHCQIYQQGDGSSRVYITNTGLSYPAAEIIYYTYGWGTQNGIIQNGTGANIYDVTTYQSSTPAGTLIFDSSNYSSYPINESLSVGALSKTSGSFRINHPLPALKETHELVHSFIEGPKADLIYRGMTTLVNGVAIVNIDTMATMTEGTFEVLCRDVQCFVNNTTGWDPVRANVSGNILTIFCQNTNSNDTISWMVVGERHDPHMYETHWTDNNGRVIVEPLKAVIIDPPPGGPPSLK